MDHPVAIVTAASKGIGRACARALAEDGHRLVLFSRSEAVEAAAAEVGGVGVRGHLEDPSALSTLVDRALEIGGRIDAVVINAGHPARGELFDLTDPMWRGGIDLLLMSVIRLTRLITPTMLKHGGGAFVNISTLGAEEPDLAFPISSTVRAGLAAYAKLFATRYAADGVRMNTILPGFVDTFPVDPATVASIPAGRPATAEEIAATARFLVSTDAASITGQTLRVDGGLGRSV